MEDTPEASGTANRRSVSSKSSLIYTPSLWFFCTFVQIYSSNIDSFLWNFAYTQKRTRAQTIATAAKQTSKASVSGGDNRDEASDRSDQSPAEGDDSFDDFEGPRQKLKRKQASEGASAIARKDDQSLIGKFKFAIPQFAVIVRNCWCCILFVETLNFVYVRPRKVMCYIG